MLGVLGVGYAEGADAPTITVLPTVTVKPTEYSSVIVVKCDEVVPAGALLGEVVDGIPPPPATDGVHPYPEYLERT